MDFIRPYWTLRNCLFHFDLLSQLEANFSNKEHFWKKSFSEFLEKPRINLFLRFPKMFSPSQNCSWTSWTGSLPTIIGAQPTDFLFSIENIPRKVSLTHVWNKKFQMFFDLGAQLVYKGVEFLVSFEWIRFTLYQDNIHQ